LPLLGREPVYQYTRSYCLAYTSSLHSSAEFLTNSFSDAIPHCKTNIITNTHTYSIAHAHAHTITHTKPNTISHSNTNTVSHTCAKYTSPKWLPDTITYTSAN
jgi:hypothetical protein